MLSEELLRLIQADRAREIAAAERVRWLRPAGEPDGTEPQAERAVTRRSGPARRHHAGTGSTATDPCL
jgi:hypothetical protein